MNIITLLHKVSACDYSGDMTKINTTKQGGHSATGFPCAVYYRSLEYKNQVYVASLHHYFHVILLMRHIFIYLMHFVCTIIIKRVWTRTRRNVHVVLYRVRLTMALAMVKNRYMKISSIPLFCS